MRVRVELFYEVPGAAAESLEDYDNLVNSESELIVHALRRFHFLDVDIEDIELIQD